MNLTRPPPQEQKPHEPRVITQIKRAFSRSSALATSVGFLLGAFVPMGTYMISHYELQHHDEIPLWSQPLAYAVVGGLFYSAYTVWQWASLAFRSTFKATAFVILIETIMVLSHITWLNIAALVYLIFINGTATGCLLAEDEQQDKLKEQEEINLRKRKKRGDIPDEFFQRGDSDERI
jgi:hypothetical protein